MNAKDLHGLSPDMRLLSKTLQRPQLPAALSMLDNIAEQLFERLSLLKHPPARIMDLGAGDARHLSQLQTRFPKAEVFATDLSLQRLQTASGKRRFWQKRPLLVCLDAGQALPFANDSVDLVVSNMMLPWVFNPDDLMIEINRLLVKDGALFISTAGPDTLIELRQAWAEIDDCQHINAFIDMHDVGDLMMKAGIADPVLDTQRLTVTYSSVDALLAELVGLGFINVLAGRRKGLTAASVKARLAEVYPVNKNGGIDATLELVVAHGWSGVPKAPQGDFYFPLEKLQNR